MIESLAQDSTPLISFEDSNVCVAVRARPSLEKESIHECVSYSSDGKEVVIGKERRFTFDHVFSPCTSQKEVYQACVQPLVESCIAGYNATVIAYGQTGSGKTHTMGTASNDCRPDEDLGILPRVIHELYKSMDKRSQIEFIVKCSFVEIYNEEIKDLLHVDTPPKSISIRDDANGDIIIAGVKEEAVTTYEDMLRCLEQGSSFRTTGSTLMNQQSSRSHAIFTMNIEQHSREKFVGGSSTITSKFHLVDLAGSERAKRTGAVGVRFKESVTINCGLLALGNVISALGDERKRGQHVPYRESKLTRILQDSLGGNSKTCMIACISTSDINFEETLNTLKYANRARNIKNKPIINCDDQTLKLTQLQCEVKLLQHELLKLKTQSASDAEDKLQQQNIGTRFGEPLLYSATALQNLCQKSIQAELQMKQDAEASKTHLKKLEDELINLRSQSAEYQSKYSEVWRNMNVLSHAIPQWQEHGVIAVEPGAYLHTMAKRIQSLLNGATVDSTKQTTPDSMQEVSLAYSASVEQEDKSTADVTNKHLENILILEEKLIARDNDLKEKAQELLEAKKDLARDEKIFLEKMKEIEALTKLARDLKVENEELLQKKAADTAMISQLSADIAAKDNELNRLKALLFPQKNAEHKLQNNQVQCDICELEKKVAERTSEHSKRLQVENAHHGDKDLSNRQDMGSVDDYGKINLNMKAKLEEMASAWKHEKKAMKELLRSEREAWEAKNQQTAMIHMQLERDHQALKEELENTKSLMQKAGLGIRLSAHNVRELSDGDVDIRTSVSLPSSSRESPIAQIF